MENIAQDTEVAGKAKAGTDEIRFQQVFGGILESIGARGICRQRRVLHDVGG